MEKKIFLQKHNSLIVLSRIIVLPLHKIICNYVKKEGCTYFKQLETSKFMFGV